MLELARPRGVAAIKDKQTIAIAVKYPMRSAAIVISSPPVWNDGAGTGEKLCPTSHQRLRKKWNYPFVSRSVAQPGRAPRSGRGGRRFKSCHSDQYLADPQIPFPTVSPTDIRFYVFVLHDAAEGAMRTTARVRRQRPRNRVGR